MGVLPAAVRPIGASFGTGRTNRTSSLYSNYAAFTENTAFTATLGIGLATLSLMTFLGNAMVVHAIRTERKLHTVSNMFILSLAIADLIVGLMVMPLSSTYVLFGDWILGLFVCQLWLVIDYTASTASIFNLLILSLDRYWSIRSPLKYLCKRTKKRALAMIGIVWMISALWAIPIIGWHMWYNNGIRKHPDNVCETEFSDSVVFKITTSIANFIVPMCLMVILYYKIYREIKRRGNFSDISQTATNRVLCHQHRSKSNGLRNTFRTSFSSVRNKSTIIRKGKKSQQQPESNSKPCKQCGKSKLQFRPSISKSTTIRTVNGHLIRGWIRSLKRPNTTTTTMTTEIRADEPTTVLPVVTPTSSGRPGAVWPDHNSSTVIECSANSSDPTVITTRKPIERSVKLRLVNNSSCTETTTSVPEEPLPSSLINRISPPILRDLKLEHLSHDNGHRIMMNSLPKRLASNAEKLNQQISSSATMICDSPNICHNESCTLPWSKSNSIRSSLSSSSKSFSLISSCSSSSSLSSLSLLSSSKADRNSICNINNTKCELSDTIIKNACSSFKSCDTRNRKQISFYSQLILMSLQPKCPKTEPCVPSNSSEQPSDNSPSIQSSIASDCDQTISFFKDHFTGINVKVEYITGDETIETKPIVVAKNDEQNNKKRIKRSKSVDIIRSSKTTNNNKCPALSINGEDFKKKFLENGRINLKPQKDSSRVVRSKTIDPKPDSADEIVVVAKSNHSNIEKQISISTLSENTATTSTATVAMAPTIQNECPRPRSIPLSDPRLALSPSSPKTRKKDRRKKKKPQIKSGNGLVAVGDCDLIENSVMENRDGPGCSPCSGINKLHRQQCADSIGNISLQSFSNESDSTSLDRVRPMEFENPEPDSVTTIHHQEANKFLKSDTLTKQNQRRKYSFYDSFHLKIFDFSRGRSASIVQQTETETCEHCKCMASALSAAAIHRNELKREESSRLRQEKKAARQLGVILGAFILCWTPYIITYVVTAYCAYCVSLTVHQVTIWLGYLNSFLNPFLYALCNENFKHAFKKMLGKLRRAQNFSYNFDNQQTTTCHPKGASFRFTATKFSKSTLTDDGAGVAGGGGIANDRPSCGSPKNRKIGNIQQQTTNKPHHQQYKQRDI